jgi:hypothetical protein
MDTPTHYELLCVTPEATADEIRNSYRRLIRLYHPDVAGAAGEAMTLRLNDAKHELLDPSLRARYDRAHAYAAYAGASTRSSTTYARRPAPAREAPIHDDWRPPASERDDRPAAARPTELRLWMGIAVGSIAVIIAITVIVFAWSYSGELGLTTPRVIPPLVVAVAWLVAGLSRPSKLFVALLVIGCALWPLSALGVPPFALLTDSVPIAVLAAVTVLGLAVLALRVSAPRIGRLSRVRHVPA